LGLGLFDLSHDLRAPDADQPKDSYALAGRCHRARMAGAIDTSNINAVSILRKPISMAGKPVSRNSQELE
jgi:hypothetical protein